MGSSDGERIRKRREELGLTRRQIALALDVVESTIFKWETGATKPRMSPSETKKLCSILQTSLDELAGDDAQPEG